MTNKQNQRALVATMSLASVWAPAWESGNPGLIAASPSLLLLRKLSTNSESRTNNNIDYLPNREYLGMWRHGHGRSYEAVKAFILRSIIAAGNNQDKSFKFKLRRGYLSCLQLSSSVFGST